MEIILLTAVKGLGKVGSKVEVKSGYARNYLVPRGLAVRANKESIEALEKQLKDLEKENLNRKEKATTVAAMIEGKHVIFLEQASSNGKLFGAVSAKSVAQEVSKLAKLDVNYSAIDLPGGVIKNIGSYAFTVTLHPDVKAKMLLIVAKTAEEANERLRVAESASSVSTETSTEDLY